MIKNILNALQTNSIKGLNSSKKTASVVTAEKLKKESEVILDQDGVDTSLLSIDDAVGQYSMPSISELPRYADAGEAFTTVHGQKMMIGSVTGVQESVVAASTSWGSLTWTAVGIGVLAGGGIALASAGGGGSSPSAPVSTTEPEVSDCPSWNDPLDEFDATLWEKSDWANGGVFASEWDPAQITFDQGVMTITLDTVDGDLVSGEYRTDVTYGYGLYEISMKASDVEGTINGFFTYTGGSEGTRHDEIDFEIKGDDPTKVQLNYWTNDVEHPTLIDLGFDASADFHTYAFTWREDRIDWYVDDVLIHTEDGSDGELPSVPGKLFINLWASEGTESWSSDYDVANGSASLYVDYVSTEVYQCAAVI
jgi:hypothetical protein